MGERKNVNRRNFLKGLGVAGLAPFVAGAENDPNMQLPVAEDKDAQPIVPKRALGRTGEKIPVLSLGVMFDAESTQAPLYKSHQWGVTYWDTASGYANGKSEHGIGKYLAKNPDKRKELFIVTKASGATKPEEVEASLQESLKRMNTDYIDLFYGVHGCGKTEQLTDELRDWAAEAKKRGVIKYFGFSTHNNMAEVMMAASKLDWIDGIMTSWNFRLMQDAKMQEAVDACHKAGIALIAMKIMAQKVESEEDKKFTDHFIEQGYTEGQAKLKAVLADERFCNACVGMENLTHMNLDIAVALDRKELASGDMEFLKEYASQNCAGYCAGCTSICDNALGCESRVGEVMRYLMYYNSYHNQQEHARELFAELPASVRNALLSRDYSAAESVCPQKLPISKLIEQAVSKLA